MSKVFSKIPGLILRESAYRESDKILTILTGEGLITARARRARTAGSSLRACTQVLAYCDFLMFAGKSSYTVNEAEPIQLFTKLRTDMAKFSLAAYFAELLESVSGPDMGGPELLRLALNSLYALETALKPAKQIKAAFEMRLVSLSGFMPLLGSCRLCGSGLADYCFFGVADGGVVCSECAGESGGDRFSLEMPQLLALRHIVGRDLKKYISFALEDGLMDGLAALCESFALYHLDRKFGALHFYKNICQGSE